MAKKWVSTTDMYKAKAKDRRKRMGISSKRRRKASSGCLVSLLSMFGVVLTFLGLLIILIF